MICEYFLKCNNVAEFFYDHRILGDVPCCTACKGKIIEWGGKESEFTHMASIGRK